MSETGRREGEKAVYEGRREREKEEWGAETGTDPAAEAR